MIDPRAKNLLQLRAENKRLRVEVERLKDWLSLLEQAIFGDGDPCTQVCGAPAVMRDYLEGTYDV
jgi:hypothetical protein